MYLFLGQDTIVNDKDIIGIFDIDTTTVSKRTREFLSFAEKRKQVVNVTYELPKSFILCKEKDKEALVYISQLSTTTLEKRSKKITIY